MGVTCGVLGGVPFDDVAVQERNKRLRVKAARNRPDLSEIVQQPHAAVVELRIHIFRRR